MCREERSTSRERECGVSECGTKCDEIDFERSMLFTSSFFWYVFRPLFPRNLGSLKENTTTGEADRQISRFLSRTRLDNLARVSKIELFVRARKQVKITTRNAWKLIKEDVQGEDRTRTAARAIKAIVGAVYYDGGFLAARKVMEDLDLTIKMPGQVEGL